MSVQGQNENEEALCVITEQGDLGLGVQEISEEDKLKIKKENENK